MNVLSNQSKSDIETLLRAGLKFREIERKLGIRRETISKYAVQAGFHPKQNSKPASGEEVATGTDDQNRPATDMWPPDGDESKKVKSVCEEHREWIEEQIRLGRNAISIY